jgi:hypothetical protein
MWVALCVSKLHDKVGVRAWNRSRQHASWIFIESTESKRTQHNINTADLNLKVISTMHMFRSQVPFAGTQQQFGSALQHAFAQPFSSQLPCTARVDMSWPAGCHA